MPFHLTISSNSTNTAVRLSTLLDAQNLLEINMIRGDHSSVRIMASATNTQGMTQITNRLSQARVPFDVIEPSSAFAVDLVSNNPKLILSFVSSILGANSQTWQQAQNQIRTILELSPSIHAYQLMPTWVE